MLLKLCHKLLKVLPKLLKVLLKVWHKLLHKAQSCSSCSTSLLNFLHNLLRHPLVLANRGEEKSRSFANSYRSRSLFQTCKVGVTVT